jgi:hypothetical protein
VQSQLTLAQVQLQQLQAVPLPAQDAGQIAALKAQISLLQQTVKTLTGQIGAASSWVMPSEL